MKIGTLSGKRSLGLAFSFRRKKNGTGTDQTHEECQQSNDTHFNFM